MKLKISAIVVMLLGACGGQTSTLSSGHTMEIVDLGVGYNPIADDLVNSCVDVAENTTREKTGYGTVMFYKNLSASEYRKAITGEAKGKLDAGGAIGIDARTEYEGKNAADSLSSTFTVVAKVEGFSNRIADRSLVKFNPIALAQFRRNDPKSQLQVCGDRYVSQVNYGAYYTATLKIDYENRSQKENFEAALKMDVANGLVTLEGNVKIDESQWAKKINVSFTQEAQGGNPAALPGNLSTNMVECDGTKAGLEKCMQQMTDVIKYAKESFPIQLGQGRPSSCAEPNTNIATEKNDKTIGNGLICTEVGDVDPAKLVVTSYLTTPYTEIEQTIDNADGESVRIVIPSEGLSRNDLIILQDLKDTLVNKFETIRGDRERIKFTRKRLLNQGRPSSNLDSIDQRTFAQLVAYKEAIPYCDSWINEHATPKKYSPEACQKAVQTLAVRSAIGGNLYYDSTMLETRPQSFAEWCELYSQAKQMQPEEAKWVMSPATIRTVGAILATQFSQDQVAKPTPQLCIEAQSKLKGLRSIELKGAGNLEPLTGLRRLNTVIIRDPSNIDFVTDISPLAQLPRLEELEVVGLDLPLSAGFDKLAGIPSLTRIDISENELSTLSFLASMPMLKEIKAVNTVLTDIGALAQPNCKLRKLDVSNNNIKSVIAVLDSCKELTENVLFDTRAFTDEKEIEDVCSRKGVSCNP